ncbi:MAG: hypothetical protein RJB20_500 [Pseudomonadota bacterium]
MLRLAPCLNLITRINYGYLKPCLMGLRIIWLPQARPPSLFIWRITRLMFVRGLSAKQINRWQLSSWPPSIIGMPSWLFISYDIWHSFVVCIPIIALVACWRQDIAFAILAWPFHIVLDFPFHSLNYFPTQIFWPISDFTIDGIPWSNPELWLPNVAGLIILLAYRYQHKRRPKSA